MKCWGLNRFLDLKSFMKTESGWVLPFPTQDAAFILLTAFGKASLKVLTKKSKLLDMFLKSPPTTAAKWITWVGRCFLNNNSTSSTLLQKQVISKQNKNFLNDSFTIVQVSYWNCFDCCILQYFCDKGSVLRFFTWKVLMSNLATTMLVINSGVDGLQEKKIGKIYVQIT